MQPAAGESWAQESAAHDFASGHAAPAGSPHVTQVQLRQLLLGVQGVLPLCGGGSTNRGVQK